MLDLKEEASQYTLETILKRIHYYRCHSYIQLIALSNILHQSVAQCENKVSTKLLGHMDREGLLCEVGGANEMWQLINEIKRKL